LLLDFGPRKCNQHSMTLASPLAAPRAVVTCGPGVSPIDAVRRITNFSTGELGVRLAECLSEYGWAVSCFKSTDATYRNPENQEIALRKFTTNQDLRERLVEEPNPEEVDVVFHAAALSDYEVAGVQDLQGDPIEGLKISSHHAGLAVILTPAPKLLPELQSLFPRARIVGWKFEMDGDRSTALERGIEQIRQSGTALCVVNGLAFGEGFGILDPQGSQRTIFTRSELCNWLSNWAGRLIPG